MSCRLSRKAHQLRVLLKLSLRLEPTMELQPAQQRQQQQALTLSAPPHHLHLLPSLLHKQSHKLQQVAMLVQLLKPWLVAQVSAFVSVV